MSHLLKALIVGMVLTAAMPVAQADAVGNRTLQRAQNPIKPDTCKPKWPYVVLTCVA